jgi:segregation and condensation protein B
MSLEQSPFSEKTTALEAALYSAGHPLEMNELMHAIDTRSERVVRKTVEELSRHINVRNSAFEVTMLPNGRAVMRLREDYSELVKLFTHKPLLTKGPLKTLGFIAYNQPIQQSTIISNRGVHIYGHLKMLEHAGLIIREKQPDQSTIIKTTSFFADYFGLSTSTEKAKLQIMEMFSSLHVEEPNSVLTDSRDRLANGFPQYSGTSDQRLE